MDKSCSFFEYTKCNRVARSLLDIGDQAETCAQLFYFKDCDALGFEMDCGHAFSEKYGNAANNHEALDRIIDDVTDISLLGSAIYSQWRYFNHWAYDAAEILEPKNRAGFILALSRLALLSGDNPFNKLCC